MISPPAGVYFVAFVSRLTNTCDSRAPSASNAIDLVRQQHAQLLLALVPIASEVDSTAS